MAVISLYEAIRHIFMAMIYGCARPRMVVLFLSSIFPHLYGWWTYFNYYNDDFYQQWWHQLFFSLTELFSTLMVLHLINRSNITSLPRKLLFIIRYINNLILFEFKLIFQFLPWALLLAIWTTMGSNPFWWILNSSDGFTNFL